MGVAHRTLVIIERKKHARRHILANITCEHLFADWWEALDGEAHCFVCGFIHDLDNIEACDVWIAGIPCQPFVACRDKGGSTAKTGSVENHPDFEIFNTGVVRAISARKPKAVLIENVTQLTCTIPGKSFSWLWRLTRDLVQASYHVTTLNLDVAVHVAQSRPRLCGTHMQHE